LEVPDFPDVVIYENSIDNAVELGTKRLKELLTNGEKAKGYSLKDIICSSEFRKAIAFKHIHPGD
jgi:hypothetical protein